MITEIALSIEATHVGGAQESSVILDRLNGLGGRMVSWTPELNGHPATALFRFQNPVRCERFLAEALVIPGVART
jgi:hypothetical protein